MKFVPFLLLTVLGCCREDSAAMSHRYPDVPADHIYWRQDGVELSVSHVEPHEFKCGRLGAAATVIVGRKEMDLILKPEKMYLTANFAGNIFPDFVMLAVRIFEQVEQDGVLIRGKELSSPPEIVGNTKHYSGPIREGWMKYRFRDIDPNGTYEIDLLIGPQRKSDWCDECEQERLMTLLQYGGVWCVVENAKYLRW